MAIEVLLSLCQARMHQTRFPHTRGSKEVFTPPAHTSQGLHAAFQLLSSLGNHVQSSWAHVLTLRAREQHAELLPAAKNRLLGLHLA